MAHAWVGLSYCASELWDYSSSFSLSLSFPVCKTRDYHHLGPHELYS